jgi:hypothetical protein
MNYTVRVMGQDFIYLSSYQKVVTVQECNFFVIPVTEILLHRREGENFKILILFCKLFAKALVVALVSEALAMCLQISYWIVLI